MSLARWQATITDEAGNIVPSAQVTVRAEIAGSPLARLYTDRAGTVAAANPITADADGFVYFHVTGGAYRITATKGAFSREWRYVGIGRNAESDLAGLRPQGAWDAEISYSSSDYIRHNERTFVSLVDENLGNEPPDAPADSDVWMWVPLGENAELAIEAREEAEAQAGYAEEWAQSLAPISVPAGGDGATDRSSKWHADRSGEEADRSETARDLAQEYASNSVDASGLLPRYASVALLLADTALGYSISATHQVSEGVVVWGGAHRYRVAASSAGDHHVVTAGGVKLYVLPNAAGEFHDEAFGVLYDDTTDNTVALRKAVNAAAQGTLKMGSSGRALISGGIELPSSITIKGGGPGATLVSTGTNKTIFYGSGKEFISISAVCLEGNNTGLGGAGENGGCGIHLTDCNYVSIRNCIIDKIGHLTNSNSTVAIGVQGGDSGEVVISENLFLPGSRSTTGADISVGRTKNTTIANNVSLSKMDSMISIASTGTGTIEQISNHAITGNVGVRQPDDTDRARSGILAVYAGAAGFVTITGNVMQGFYWCGVYISAGAADDGEDSGAVVVSNNVLRYCGGLGTITHGIYVAGYTGTVVSGNLIAYSGMDSDGSVRGDTHGAIGVVQNSRNVSITGNVIHEPQDYGIILASLTGGIEDVVISGNVIRKHAGPAIGLISNSSTGVLKNITVSGNVAFTEADAYGVFINFPNSGSADRISITNNQLKSSGSTTSRGLYASGRFPGKITGNTFTGYSMGLSLAGGGDRSLLRTLLVRENTYIDCATARSLSSNNSRQVSLDDKFTNCTSLGAPVDLTGTQIGVDASGDILVELSLTATPANGEWLRGDRVLNLTPSAGGTVGWVCVTAGSPGTWKTFGTIAS